MSPLPPAFSIRRLTELEFSPALRSELDAIFFVTSATKTFPDAAARDAFRQRWLGRYLEEETRWAYVALTGEGSAAGYLVGAIDDPAFSSRFSDIGYFAQLTHLTARYPAHLHVNLAPAWRDQGLGAALIETFAADAVRAGAPGVHVVTDPQSRNVGFYLRNGFAELARAEWGGRTVVFLGRQLGEAPA